MGASRKCSNEGYAMKLRAMNLSACYAQPPCTVTLYDTSEIQTLHKTDRIKIENGIDLLIRSRHSVSTRFVGRGMSRPFLRNVAGNNYVVL